MSEFYRRDYANIHRGVYELSERATEAFEGARDKVRDFLNAESREIVFVRGATEAINLVAATYGAPERRSRRRDPHHRHGAPLEHRSVAAAVRGEGSGARGSRPSTTAASSMLDEFEKLLSPRTRIVAVTHVSNALGTVNPVREIAELAHARGVPVLVDGAQAVPHTRVDVRDLDCDFYAFSGHKLFGPSGVGVLYGKAELLEDMPPYQGGGEMILSVSFEKSTFKEIPHKFEAGTPDIAGAVGLGAAIDYVNGVGFDADRRPRGRPPGLRNRRCSTRFPGCASSERPREKASVLSFVLDGIHPHDVGTILDQEGIAVRTGHHCAQPVMERFGVPATTRASLALYNTRADLDALAAGIRKVQEIFS